MEYSIIIETINSTSVPILYEFFKSGSLNCKNKCISTAKTDPRSNKAERITVSDMRVKDNKILAKWEGHGTIRLFKHIKDKELEYDDKVDPEKGLVRVPGDNSMCSILFTPSYLNCEDLLNWFLGPVILDQVSHFRLVKLDQKKGEYMVLMKFRNFFDAKRFQSEFNGKKFNSLDSKTCHVVFVKEIVFKEMLFPDPNKDFPYLLRDPFTNGSGMVELPTCPVCLERLDSDTTGLITTACQHTFHFQCLDRWKSGRCPVCRYSNNRDNINTSEQLNCNVCGRDENLWVCLICGHMGCGRYNSKHAIYHYETTSHCFAMDITTNRVWDYAGDNYVHRLVQNEVDGKLVEVGGSTSKHNQEYHLEYVQVLISQLESQREYYEGKLKSFHDSAVQSDADELKSKFENLKLDMNQISTKFEFRIKSLKDELKEEKLMNQGLSENLDHALKQKEQLLTEKASLVHQNSELQQTINDLMFHLQTKEKLSQDSETAQATLVIRSTNKEKKASHKKKPPHRFIKQ